MKIEELLESAAWQKKSGKNPSGGLNQKGVNSYRREHPGSKLKTAVTTKPSKLKKGSKASKRRKSFCARMKGMKKHRTGAKTAHDPNSRINKSLRKWHCESIEEMRELIMLGESYIAEVKQRLDAKCWTGKHKEGTKIKGGVRVNNCVPNESVEEGWKDAAAAAAMVGALGTGAYQGAKHSAPTTNIDGKQFIMYRHTPGNYEKNKMKLTTDDAGNKVYAWVTTSGMKPQYTYRYYIPAKEGVKEGRTGLGGLSTATSRAHQASRFGHDPDRAAPVYRPNKDGYIAPRNGSGDESNIILQLKKNLDRAVGKPLSFQDGSVLEIRPKTARQALSIIADMRPVERHETIKNIMQSKDAFIGFVKSQNNSVDEAANAAQQAAIAIAKKKDKGVDENFADGKGPGRPGDSARHGIPKHATKAELEKASYAKGRKGQLARWQINMRNGKNK